MRKEGVNFSCINNLQRLKILSNKKRFMIFKLVKKHKELMLEELAKKINMDIGELSFHLSLMVDFGVLRNVDIPEINFSVTEETEKLIGRIEKGQRIIL
jgi:predicted transcriptional regulator